VTRYASAHDVKVFSCKVDLRAYFDQRGKLGLDESSCGAQRLVYEVALESDASPEQVRAMLRDAVRGCYAHQTFAIPVPIETCVRLNGDELALDD
jgi:uncharacterized OsmC-like protein